MNAIASRSMVNKKTTKILNLYSYNVPNIVIVGKKEIRRKILNIEEDFNVFLVFSDPNDLLNLINKQTVAIIIDEKSVGNKITTYLKAVLNTFKYLPVFYLSRTSKRSSFYSSLYRGGLQGAINWPEEASILHDLIIESLKPHSDTIGDNKGDKQLSEMIKTHLILVNNYKNIKVKVIAGFVFLEGSVKSLFDKRMIERESDKVLGVKKVISKDICVRNNNKITDREIERKIKMYAGNILGESKRTTLVKVKDKVVTLSGLASNHGDVIEVENFSMKQQGVKEVIRNIKYKPSVVLKNTKIVKSLEQKIKNIFEGAKHISLSLYGDYAEVSGFVKIRADRSLIQDYILQSLPVKKVINKLYIVEK
jgi:osmotically-inducible protein OsmY